MLGAVLNVPAAQCCFKYTDVLISITFKFSALLICILQMHKNNSTSSTGDPCRKSPFSPWDLPTGWTCSKVQLHHPIVPLWVLSRWRHVWSQHGKAHGDGEMGFLQMMRWSHTGSRLDILRVTHKQLKNRDDLLLSFVSVHFGVFAQLLLLCFPLQWFFSALLLPLLCIFEAWAVMGSNVSGLWTKGTADNDSKLVSGSVNCMLQKCTWITFQDLSTTEQKRSNPNPQWLSSGMFQCCREVYPARWWQSSRSLVTAFLNHLRILPGFHSNLQS